MLRWVIEEPDNCVAGVVILIILMTLVSRFQVDASAGKDKLVGKVTSGITDLLGIVFGLLSEVPSRI
jgi:hypothetical protein